MKRLWRNPAWLTLAAYIILIPYLWIHRHDGREAWLLVAFLILIARAAVIR